MTAIVLVAVMKKNDDIIMHTRYAQVPSTHPPKYIIHPGVTLVPINGIARLDKSWEKYVVIGGEK